MSKKIDIKLDRKIYVTANYNKYSDEFDIGMQTWEPTSSSDSFIIATIPFTYDSHISRETLVRKQLGKLDTKEVELRKEFNEDMLQVGDIRQKLLALTYDGDSQLYDDEAEHEAALVNDLGPESYKDTNDVNDDIPF